MNWHKRLEKVLRSGFGPVVLTGAMAFVVLASVAVMQNRSASPLSAINPGSQTACFGFSWGDCASSYYISFQPVSGATTITQGQSVTFITTTRGYDYDAIYPQGTPYPNVAGPNAVANPQAYHLNTNQDIAGKTTDLIGNSVTYTPTQSTTYCLSGANEVNYAIIGTVCVPITVTQPAQVQPTNDITVACGGDNELGCPGGTFNNVGQITLSTTATKSISVQMAGAAHQAGDAIVATAIVQIPGGGSAGNPDAFPYAPGTYGNIQAARGTGVSEQYTFVATPATPPGTYYFYPDTATTYFAWSNYPATAGGWNNAATISVFCGAGTTQSGNSCVASDLCPSLAGNQTSYPGGSSPAGSCTCPATYTYNQTSNSCVAPAAGPITATIAAKVNGTAATGLSVGQTANINATFAASSGDTLTNTGIADNTNNYLSGGTGTPQSARLYNFTPTAPGQYLFNARAASTQHASDANYAAVILTVCSSTQTWNGSTCVAAGTTTPPPPGQPTLRITGNGQIQQVIVTLGQAVSILGTFAAASGDTLTRTALNDFQNNALPGVSNTTATSPKSYTFTATAPGDYVFYPAAQTVTYPSWNNYNQSLTVTVNCPAGQSNQGGACVVATQSCNGAHQTGTQPNCTCVSGYSMQNGQCVATTQPPPAQSCNGAHQTGTQPNCACDVGYSMQGGQCVQNQCAGAHEVNWPACTCAAGYVRDGGSSQCIRQPVLDITVNGAASVRVRKASPVTLAWSATGVASGSCSVSDGVTTIASGASGSKQVAVSGQTTYRLSCLNDAGGAVSKTANVSLIPDYNEI